MGARDRRSSRGAAAAVAGLVGLLIMTCRAPETGDPLGDGSAGGKDSGGGGGLIVVKPDSGGALDGAAVADALTCEPGAVFCVSHTESAKCAAGGTSHSLPTKCAVSRRCNPETGKCAIPKCLPGVPKCEGLFKTSVCVEPGFDGVSLVTPCPTGQLCHEGACASCQVGEPTCADPVTTATCGAAGPVDEIPCGDGMGCHETTGACAPQVCSPGETGCLTALTYRYCLPSGTGWNTETYACPDEFSCFKGQCVYEPCVPDVLLLVDRSGSMHGAWPLVRNSVVKIVAENPQALFGLVFFPSSGACGVSSSPLVPMDYNAPEVFEDLFDLYQALGATPLRGALYAVYLAAGGIFGAYGGSLVVLSDGADTCAAADPTQDLADLSSALLADHQVRTYVVGYDYQGATDQLNAIASHGGTAWEEFIEVGSEAELVDVFRSVINDFKLCVPSRIP